MQLRGEMRDSQVPHLPDLASDVTPSQRGEEHVGQMTPQMKGKGTVETYQFLKFWVVHLSVQEAHQ